jgi:Flp pilus assembly protein TadG
MTLFPHSRWQRFEDDESGSGLIDFAVTASVLMMVIFGILDCSRALYADHYVSEMARHATRYAMVRGSTWAATCSSSTIYSCNAGSGTTGSANVSNYVKSITPVGVSISHLTVTTTWPGQTATGATASCTVANSPGCIVTSHLSYNFNFVLPFLPKSTMVLTSTSSVTIQQ